MHEYLNNIRFRILVSTILIIIVSFYIVNTIYPEGQQRLTKLTEIYALLSVFYLYLSLLISPFLHVFGNIRPKQLILKSRRAVGVSAFLFAWLHTLLSFFGQLGGFSGLFFLDNRYLLAIGLGAAGLLILSIMASTSFDYMISFFSFKKWKLLHRLVYFGAVAILIHTLMLGSQFSDISGFIPQTSFLLLTFLLFLESLRFDHYLAKKFSISPRFGIGGLLWIVLTTAFAILLFLPPNIVPSLNIHAAHIALAQEAQNANSTTIYPAQLSNLPALVGNRTRRFSVSFNHPSQIVPGQNVTLSFAIFDGSSGNPVQLFSNIYSKTMHLIIVDQDLNYFSHIHPVQQDSEFTVDTSFPKNGRYHIYINFQPTGAIEQTFGFVVDVGQVDTAAKSNISVDSKYSDTTGHYRIDLVTKPPYFAKEMSIGQQTLKFHLTDTTTNQPVTNLKPYLASFGHMTLVNIQTYDFLHIHPTNLVAPAPDSSSGPDVEFLPLGIYGPIKPGVYKAFVEFNPSNQLVIPTFTLTLE